MSTAHTPPHICPVCQTTEPRHLLNSDDKDYWACDQCGARFLDPGQLPAREVEFQHYQLHENDPDDPRYRAFLSKLATPLLARLTPNQNILDYGAGPGPALAAMMREAGHTVSLYDPFFATDDTVLAQTYDVVTCTETAEHFHEPAAEFARFDALLRPGGLLGLLTTFQTDDAKFANWHYRKDPTHVVFYRAATFEYIATRFGWRCEIPAKDVVLMQKPG